MVKYLTKTNNNNNTEEVETNSDNNNLIELNRNQNNNSFNIKNRFLSNLKLSSIATISNNTVINKEIIDSDIKSATISALNVDRNEETEETTTFGDNSCSTSSAMTVEDKVTDDNGVNNNNNESDVSTIRVSHNNRNWVKTKLNQSPNYIKDDPMCPLTDDLTIADTNGVPQSNQSLPSPHLASSKDTARVLLICKKNSHTFTNRRLALDVPAKVGRAVARCKPENDNFIFDCKVLSRNHALVWYENEKFFLQDTRSSNGTFVNNQRLSAANEESAPREIYSGDVVQFGVDVLENSKKVTHGCIIATIKLFLPDGTEAKDMKPDEHHSGSQDQKQIPSNVIRISTQEIYEFSQYLNEAIHREQILENKLETLQRIVSNAQECAHSGWKSLVEEDRLLSRIETLQTKLELCLNSADNSKGDNKSIESGVKTITEIRDEMLNLVEDKEKYESAAKEAIQKALEEKLLVLTRLHEIETCIKSAEDECTRLQDVCETSAKEINRLAIINDDLNKEIEEFYKRLKQSEDRIDAEQKDKSELQKKLEELNAKEVETKQLIIELKEINATAEISIERLKTELLVMKQEKVLSDSKSDENADQYVCSDIQEKLSNLQKQLDLSNNRCSELSAQIEAYNQQMVSTVTLTSSTNLTTVETVVTPVLTNGEIISTNDSVDNDSKQECIENVIMEVNDSSDSKSTDQTTSQLNSEIDLLKELLAETRASKKSVDEELSRTLTELELLRSSSAKYDSENTDCQQKLKNALKDCTTNSLTISSMKNQINELNDRLRAEKSDCEVIKCKIIEYERNLQLKDDEINSLKVLLEEERKVQTKYANNYDNCRKQLTETQHLAKQSQTEAELLRKKVYSCNEELRSSRSNLSSIDESNKTSKEYEKLKTECVSLKAKLQTLESELISCRDSNTRFVADYESLKKSFDILNKINCELESRGDNYWREQFNSAKSESEDAQTQLIKIREELAELKNNFDDCSRDREVLNDELKSAKEDYEIVSYQTKIASACAIIPLILLLIAVLLAYYPTVSSVTGTTES